MLEFNDENFEEEVLKSEKLVLVDLWRPGCGACLIMAPVIEELAKEFEGRVKVGKLNVFENPETARSYKIPAVPTFIIFKGGKPIEKAVGLRLKQVLSDKLNSLIN
ncbi:MAG: thioredoxin domain-containing protein [Candidatus Nealsonbacteria bacterium]